MICGVTETSLCLAALVCLSAPALGALPSRTELAQCKSWTDANFASPKLVAKPVKQAGGPRSSLLVLENHSDVLKDGRPDGRPLKIGQREYQRGLICHAVSKIVVKLPRPGKSFTSTVGVDANSGGGSVVFSVSVGGQEAFRSGVMKGSEPGMPVSVDLRGATEFTIAVGDGGDGISFDHADWADAKVILADGKELWLSDLPVINPKLPQRLSVTPPFSFTYNGKLSDTLLPTWKYSEKMEKIDPHRTRRTQTYVEPNGGLQVRVASVTYNNFPTVEWTVYFRNTGKYDTPIIENIRALDTTLTRRTGDEYKLHHFTGSPCREDDYAPLETVLTPNAQKTISAAGGRPTNSDLCYFNLELRPSHGLIIALGWPGQWAADFVRDSGRKLRVLCGQELTHLKLHPGEEIRTPLVALQFWEGGDWERAQNVWRRWMVAYNMPRPGGKLIVPQYGGCRGDIVPTSQAEIAQIEGYVKDGVKLDHWIIDCGWYAHKGEWYNIGDWVVDESRFPKGLREVADCVHANGADFIVWFEPERATPGSWVYEKRPDWVLGRDGEWKVVNLGNPDAWKWVVETVDAVLVAGGIDHYRGDYGLDPLYGWRAKDAEDRQGITENLYVQGFLAFWDELLRRHPKMYIDTCAAGGRRNDLETLRRSVPLLRSDYPLTDFTIGSAHGQQSQTYAISYWIPYHGTGAPSSDIYTMRSSYCPIARFGYDALDPKRNTALLRQAVGELRELVPYWLGDFHALTPYSRSKSDWMAWQLDSPENGGGFVQAFRRENCAEATMRFTLSGLDPKSDYLVTSHDDGDTRRIAGRELLDRGVQVTIPGNPGSALIVYKKVR